jgi:hypothetical protein
MSLSTKSSGNTPSINRKEKTEELLQEHMWKFERLNELNPFFVPKSAYIPRGKTEHHIGVFPSEFKRGADMYLEFTSFDLVPEDPKRTLYRLRANPYYDEEFEKTDDVNFRYLVPVSELEVVKFEEPEVLPEQTTLFPDFNDMISEDDDCKVSDLTARDLVAIIHKIPVSKKQWLNNLIKA